MAESKKKIRELNRDLSGGKTPADLKEVVNAIEKTLPHEPSLSFQKDLRNELLMKHKNMAKKAPAKKFKLPNFSLPVFGGFKWQYAVSVFAIVILAGVISYPFVPAPTVEGYSIKSNVREISYNAPIRIVFSQLMDSGSVEKAFEIEPKVEGKFQWRGNTLTFKPNEQFRIGQQYKVSIGKSAKSLLQKPMMFDYVENYEITGPPQVILFNPSEGSEFVPVTENITIMFDRPMVALSSLDAGEASMPEIKIEPKANGRFKWLGTDAITFIPEKLAYSTQYKITIPKGTKSLEGGLTDEDFVMNFSTLKPALISSNPYNRYQYNGEYTKPALEFNQPMKLENISGFVTLYKYKGALDADRALHDDLSKTAVNDWKKVDFSARYKNKDDELKERKAMNFEEGEEIDESKLKNTIYLVPKNKLPFNSVYLLKVEKGLMPSEGHFALEHETSLRFKTVGDLAVLWTSPDNKSDLTKNSEKNLYNARIHFSHPIEREGLEKFIELNPLTTDRDTKEQLDPSVSLYDDDTTLSIRYSFKPSTDYTMKVKAGLPDNFGQKLGSDYSFTFKTAPLEPDFILKTRSDINVIDAHKAPIIYLQTVNLDDVSFNFKRLSEEEFSAIYGNGYVSFYSANISGPFTSWTKKIENKFNEQIYTKLDLNKETNQILVPGVYYLDVSSEKVKDYHGNKQLGRYLFVVSKTGLASKRSTDELLVWATSLKDGSPQKNYAVKVLDREGNELFSGSTNADGLVSFKLPKLENDEYPQDYIVRNAAGDDYSVVYTGWSEGVAPWDFRIDYSPLQSKYYVYSYTDRPIYRPGHEVHMKGLVRIDNDAVFALPDKKQVHVVIEDPRGDTIYEKNLDVKSNGTFVDKLMISEGARGGNYTVITSFDDGDTPDYMNRFYSSFRVSEYRKPDYEMILKADKDDYVNGDKMKINVKGAYFFGAPMPDAPIEWTVKSQDYYFFLDNDSNSPFANEWFNFSEDGYYCWWGCEGETQIITTGKGKLNANGEYVIELPLDIKDKKVSQIYTVEVTAFDLNNQSVSNRVMLPVHQGEYYTGILSNEYVVQPGSKANFDIITTDYSGMPVGGRDVSVTLYKREWNTIKKKNVDAGYYYENSYDDKLVEKKNVKTNDKGRAVIDFIPKDGGNFKVVAESRDSRGNVIKSSTTMYVTSSEFVNWGRDNNDKIELVPDKLEYKPGETANILVKSPYQNVWALVTQERGGIIDRKVLNLKSNSETIQVPITDKSIPNVFVSVLLVKGNSNEAGLVEPAAGLADERYYAAFKAGYATLQVDNSTKELMIDVQSDRDKYAPREQVVLKVNTKDKNGKPVSADVSVSVVDKSVLSLTQNVTADLLNAFYRKRFLGVMSAHTLTKAISRVNVQVEAGMKGGGGGLLTKRGSFKDTAHFEGSLKTNENGYGELMFSLPDNLTTWEILAIGITDNTLVGSKKSEFLVTKDVLIRPVMPRFLIMNDKLKIGAIVHNYTDKTRTINVGLDAKGITLHDGNEKRVILKPGEEKKVEWNITVLSEKAAVMDITAADTSDKMIGDRLEQKLSISPYSFPETVSTSLTFDDNAKHVENVLLPIGIDKNYGQLKVSASPTLTSSISSGLQYLMTFPYGCAEQTASSLLPNLVLKQFLDLPSVNDNLVNQEQLAKNVESGIQSLIKYQNINGGWGIWESSEPTPYLTAYILYTLDRAEKAGYIVDVNVMKRGKDYLKKYMVSKKLINGSDYEKKQFANERAFGLFVLAELGETDIGLNQSLFDQKDNLNIFGKAYLVMAFDKVSRSSLDGAFKAGIFDKMNTLKKEILDLAKETPRGVSFEEKEHMYRLFDTNTRTTALVLQMLSRTEPNHPYIPKIIRNLLMNKQGGHYASTQETAVTLVSMIEYIKNSGELEASYKLSVTANGEVIIDKQFGESNISDQEVISLTLNQLLPDNQDNEIVFSKNGVGKVYADMVFEYYLPTEEIKPRNEGILVTHEYFRVEDKKMEKPVKEAKLGENLKVRVTLIVPQERYYVMLEDYLPAGLEGIDFSLKTSQQSLQEGKGDFGGYYGEGYGGKGMYGYSSSWDRASWYFTYSEVKDDRVMYFADYLPSGVYEITYFVRATTPGEFHDKPVLAQELYFPEVFGRSEGNIFKVLE
jgi:alpha-2-macroglobulin